MRFAEPFSGCSVTVEAFADDILCPENLSSSDNGNQQCWIAVKAGQILSIKCHTEMITKKYQIDMIVDGILRSSWLSSEVSKVQTRKASIDFSEAVVKVVRSLRFFKLTTSSLVNETTDFQPSKPITVGTIEIQISKSDRDLTHKQTAPLPDEGDQGWQALVSTPGIAGVPPTHEIIYLNGKNLKESVRRAIRTKMKRPRPGNSPWAIFRFHYRLEESLRRANLLDVTNLNKATAADADTPETDDETLLTQAQSDAPNSAHLGQKTFWPSQANSPKPEAPSRAIESKNLTAFAAAPISILAMSVGTDKSQEGPGKPRRTVSVVYDKELPYPGPAESARDGGNVVLKEYSGARKREISSTLDDNSGDSEDTPACKYCGNTIVPNGMSDQEALEAYIKVLQDKRDAKRRRTEEEQTKTETMALNLEEERVHSHDEGIWNLKAELERDIEKFNKEIAAQQKEQKELIGTA